MIENPRSEEKRKIKDIRNVFRLKKELKGIKDTILRNIENLFKY